MSNGLHIFQKNLGYRKLLALVENLDSGPPCRVQEELRLQREQSAGQHRSMTSQIDRLEERADMEAR